MNKTKPFVLFCLTFFSLAIVLPGCAKDISAMVPKTKEMRTTFHPYTTEGGEAYFVIQANHFQPDTFQTMKPYYEKWLNEYMDIYGYCKNGYRIIRNKYVPHTPLNGIESGVQYIQGACVTK